MEFRGILSMFAMIAMALLITFVMQSDASSSVKKSGSDLVRLVGQPVDIAPSAYQYSADRKPQDNPPESWIALMHYAKLPLNKPVDVNDPMIKQVLCGLLWEEIRPVQRLELRWTANAKRKPAPDQLAVATMINQGAASSWWNNLSSVEQVVKPTVSDDGMTYVYALDQDTCGIVVSVVGVKNASEYDVPAVRVLVAETWKKMDIEIEWGFDQTTANKDYSGRIESYDGIVAGLRPLDGDAHTSSAGLSSWQSVGQGSARRGMKASLLYMGTSKWRQQQPYTSQPDDVARTIVTLWTKAGSFSFLAADLENGPILAPEYGFFVRRTSKLAAILKKLTPYSRTPMVILADKMNSIASDTELLGWGSDATPWFGGNPADRPVAVQGITFPAKTLAMHPGPDRDVAAGWRSPIKGVVKVRAGVAHGQAGGNGIDWWIVRETKTDHNNLVHGSTNGTGSQAIPAEAEDQKTLDAIQVEPGDMISLVVGPKGTHVCDTTIIELAIAEVGGRGRTWDLTRDVISTLHSGNPHADAQGNADVWQFYSEKSTAPPPIPSLPPIALASQATSAKAFITELKARKLTTIRQQTRSHEEQTWESAVTAMCGDNLPPHPTPPAGFEPAMQVEVPSERLTAQWNLGVWHLVRHAVKNPSNGRLWFNDYPYGILGAETYMILAALDLMGSHDATEDGFDQWVSCRWIPTPPVIIVGRFPTVPTGSSRKATDA